MEIYRYRNPFVSILFPVFGLISFFCFYEVITKVYWVAVFPILLTGLGLAFCIKMLTFRIAVNDSLIQIGNQSIPWNRVTRIIEFSQMTESGSGIRKVIRIGIFYESDDKKSKSITVTPKDLNKPKALVSSIKKRKEIGKL